MSCFVLGSVLLPGALQSVGLRDVSAERIMAREMSWHKTKQDKKNEVLFE